MNALRARVPMVVALTTAALTTVSVQSRLQPAPGAHVVTITPPGQTGSEPAIAVNPNNPNQVVGVGGGWTAHSTDGGRTFTAVQPHLGSNRSGGDPSLAFDDKGNVFLSFLWIQRNGLPSVLGSRSRRQWHLRTAIGRRRQDVGQGRRRARRMEGR